MVDLERNLDVLAAEIGKVRFSPTGCNFDDFNFKVVRRLDGIECTYTGNAGLALRINLSNFRLAAASDADRFNPVNELYYKADVSWRSGKKKGGGHCVLGIAASRAAVLADLAVSSPDHSVINDLLFQTERIASRVFGCELAEKHRDNKERNHAEDSQSKIKVF